MQAVVDDKLRFTDINVGWPGRVHDARVLRNSSLFRRGEDGTLFPQWNRNINGVDVPVVILGDPAYPLLTWLLKGFSEGANFTREKRNFNYRLSRARMVVERAFGQLKGRWRILLRRNDTQLQKVPKLVTACCVLHNFCIQTNEEYNEEWDDHDEDVQPENEENNNVPGTSAADMRTALLAYFN
ncbi:protein ALP1-like [Anneissia japonica]|uniref:protein ALP1-like n=1 Tax=Anneissia japonica TaxID=1529436 RepID=UPI001425A1C0|nr:protein ALP1-like [Anneissia japonica]